MVLISFKKKQCLESTKSCVCSFQMRLKQEILAVNDKAVRSKLLSKFCIRIGRPIVSLKLSAFHVSAELIPIGTQF